MSLALLLLLMLRHHPHPHSSSIWLVLLGRRKVLLLWRPLRSSHTDTHILSLSTRTHTHAQALSHFLSLTLNYFKKIYFWWLFRHYYDRKVESVRKWEGERDKGSGINFGSDSNLGPQVYEPWRLRSLTLRGAAGSERGGLESTHLLDQRLFLIFWY